MNSSIATSPDPTRSDRWPKSSHQLTAGKCDEIAFGLALFFALPAIGYVAAATMTAVFLYESLAQLAFAYPARRIHTRPTPNRVLNAIIIAGVALQIATIKLAPAAHHARPRPPRWARPWLRRSRASDHSPRSRSLVAERGATK
jgi:hypothetical protein